MKSQELIMSFNSRMLSLALVAAAALPGLSSAAVTVLDESFESFQDGAFSIAIANTTATGAAGSGSRDTVVNNIDPDGGSSGAPTSNWLQWEQQVTCPTADPCIEPITLMLSGGKAFDEFRADVAAVGSTVSVKFHTQGGDWGNAINLLTCAAPCWDPQITKTLTAGVLADGVQFIGVENGFAIDNLKLILNAIINPPPGVPEPATLALVGLGLLGASWRRRAGANAR